LEGKEAKLRKGCKEKEWQVQELKDGNQRSEGDFTRWERNETRWENVQFWGYYPGTELGYLVPKKTVFFFTSSNHNTL